MKWTLKYCPYLLQRRTCHFFRNANPTVIFGRSQLTIYLVAIAQDGIIQLDINFSATPKPVETLM